MIWIFDSGLWWVLTLEYFKKLLPDYDYLYLGDTAFLPWGEKDERWIHDRSFACLNWLFHQGCSIVILACNTASAHAIRHRQMMYPQKKVLSITIPGVEATHVRHFHRVGLLATKATIQSWIYESVSKRLYPNDHLTYQSVIGSDLVDSIEAGASDKEILSMLTPLMQQFSPDIEAIILGCTHYPLIIKQIQEWMDAYFSVQIPLIDPSREAAHQFVWYLKHHPDIATKISQWWTTRYMVTGDPMIYNERILELFRRTVLCEQVVI